MPTPFVDELHYCSNNATLWGDDSEVIWVPTILAIWQASIFLHLDVWGLFVGEPSTLFQRWEKDWHGEVASELLQWL